MGCELPWLSDFWARCSFSIAGPFRNWIFRSCRGLIPCSGHCRSLSLLVFRVAISIYIVSLFFTASFAHADVRDLVLSDVTTRSFSVIWVSDEPVISSALRVYSDAGATAEIIGSLNISLVSPAGALPLGIVKYDVTGAIPNTTYYVQGDTTSSSATFTLPAVPLAPVTTEVATGFSTSAAGPLINNVLVEAVLDPDGATAATDTLLIVHAPGIANYPVSAFIGDNVASPLAYIDLSHLFDASTGTTLDLADGVQIEVLEFRGLLCPALASHAQLHLRRSPDHTAIPLIAEIAPPGACFSPSGVAGDFQCDGRIGAGDFNLLLAQFGLASNVETEECRFNADFDLNGADRTIDTADMNTFLTVFGQPE